MRTLSLNAGAFLFGVTGQRGRDDARIALDQLQRLSRPRTVAVETGQAGDHVVEILGVSVVAAGDAIVGADEHEVDSPHRVGRTEPSEQRFEVGGTGTAGVVAR